MSAAAGIKVTPLSATDRRYLARRHPGLAQQSHALVVSAEGATAEEAVSLLRALIRGRDRSLGEMQALVEAMSPRVDVAPPAAIEQARRNAGDRAAYLREHGALSSLDVAKLAGSSARNRAALANRWLKEGRVFAVTVGGRRIFPGFQFTHGQPRPVLARVLRALGDRLRGWETALWFTTRSGGLGGRRPLELLDAEPDAVVSAAERRAIGVDH